MKASVTPKMGSGGACSTSWKNEAAARTQELEPGVLLVEVDPEGTDETTPEEESAGIIIAGVTEGPKEEEGSGGATVVPLWDPWRPCTADEYLEPERRVIGTRDMLDSDEK